MEFLIFGVILLALVIIGAPIVLLCVSLKTESDRKKLNKERVQAEKEAEEHFKSKGYPVTVALQKGSGSETRWNEYKFDVTGSFDLRCVVKNISEKTINYVYLYVYAKDPIGTALTDARSLKLTGPLKPNESRTLIASGSSLLPLQRYTAGHVTVTAGSGASNTPVRSVEIQKIIVEYSDGETALLCDDLTVSVLPGNRPDAAWQPLVPTEDGSWCVKGRISYSGASPAKKMVVYATPLDANRSALASKTELSVTYDLASGQTLTCHWSGIWKGLPVAGLKIEAVSTELSSGQKKVF